MADVFISYARADKARVAPLVAAIEAKGWSVWWDPEISPGREFDDEIDTELQAAKAVLVVWTPTSVASRWVRGEARDAAERGLLVPVRFEQARLPIDVRAIHTTDLDDWSEDPASSQAQSCLAALATMIARSTAANAAATGGATTAPPKAQDAARLSVCVLPFVNMSGDPEQEYFSDGITEDIITDLNKVSALEVVSRNSAFAYKGKQQDASTIARKLKVTHVLEGSVRRAGGRVRITAQLTDATSDRQVWAERYDRDSSDIFALQDEISHAIVKALKLRLLPGEKRAIERRGTESVEAHDLYLMARQIYVTNQETAKREAQAIVRLCMRAIEVDPHYAQAWALMAMGQRNLNAIDAAADDGMQAAEHALALQPSLAEAHAVRAYILLMRGEAEAAAAGVARALSLDPESYEANRTAGRLNYQLQHYQESARLYEKAAGLMEGDLSSVLTLVSCYRALGDPVGMQRAAETGLKRADAMLARDQNNSGVVAYSAYALAALGEGERAKARMGRAMVIDPDNGNMRYNFACALSVYLADKPAALDMLDSVLSTATETILMYAKADPDFEALRGEPRYAEIIAAAEARLAKPVANTATAPSA